MLSFHFYGLVDKPACYVCLAGTTGSHQDEIVSLVKPALAGAVLHFLFADAG